VPLLDIVDVKLGLVGSSKVRQEHFVSRKKFSQAKEPSAQEAQKY
jgi:hypothetical protein